MKGQFYDEHLAEFTAETEMTNAPETPGKMTSLQQGTPAIRTDLDTTTDILEELAATAASESPVSVVPFYQTAIDEPIRQLFCNLYELHCIYAEDGSVESKEVIEVKVSEDRKEKNIRERREKCPCLKLKTRHEKRRM